jgi:fructose-1,6-bisphosphatase/inositol monophosphatase family enzyme
MMNWVIYSRAASYESTCHSSNFVILVVVFLTLDDVRHTLLMNTYTAGSNMVGYCNAKGTHAESQYDLAIATKTGDEDFCTKIDVQNEQLVIDGIRSIFPSHEIIGEESTGTGNIPPISETTLTWIIDPIDGTTNFAAGLCLTCVSIALCDSKKNKRPVLGVIYAPITQELYLAVEGCGAFRNGISISKKSSATSCTELKKAVVCCEFGYSRDFQAIATMVGAVEKVLQNGCRTLRQLGSGCLDLCYVATGRLDVVYAGVSSEGWKPWDYGAGLVIVKEAGCVMEAIDQPPDTKDFDLYSKSVICAVTQELLEDCRKVILS